MPFEVFIIAIVAISVGAGAVITIVKSVLGYLDRREERRLGVGRAGGVTTSELKGLLREAVEEATAPLVERLEALERQRPAAGLPGHDPHRLPE
ncbi:MAG: hypothetical protein D6685_03495, partial [Bacteroidetes bacterium]